MDIKKIIDSHFWANKKEDLASVLRKELINWLEGKKKKWKYKGRVSIIETIEAKRIESYNQVLDELIKEIK